MVELRIKSGLSLPTCSVDSSEKVPEKEVGGRYFWQLPERRGGKLREWLGLEGRVLSSWTTLLCEELSNDPGLSVSSKFKSDLARQARFSHLCAASLPVSPAFLQLKQVAFRITPGHLQLVSVPFL